MFFRFAIFGLGFALSLSTAQAEAPDARPVRNSFVNRRVSDVRGLVAQVASDPEVADRYERHFAMDRAAVLRFLGGLHRGSLPSTGIYTIYSVPRGGRLKMHVGRLRRGEPMFLDARGRPTLVVKCGNPVVLGPARAQRANPVVATITDAPRAQRTIAEDDEASIPSSVVASAPSDEVGSAANNRIPPAFAEVTGVPAGEPGVGAADADAPRLLGLLFPVLGSIPVTNLGRGASRGEPVPEPAGLFALAAGLGALAPRKRTRR